MLSVESPLVEQTGEQVQRLPARAVNPVVPSCEYALAVSHHSAVCKAVLDVELGNEHCTHQRGWGEEGC